MVNKIMPLLQVLDESRKVYNGDQNKGKQIKQQLNLKFKTILEYTCMFGIAAIYIFWIIQPSSYISGLCESSRNRKTDDSGMGFICRINTEGRIIEKTSLNIFFMVIFPIIYFVVKIVLNICLDRFPKIQESLNQRVGTFLRR